MSAVTGFVQANLMDMLDVLGEEKVTAILSSFSCPLNLNVKQFLRSKAIPFARMGIAATHLVFASYHNETVLVGYYALANKTVAIKARALSSRWRQRLNRFAQLNPETHQYLIALPLIGQLGKNFANGYNQLISDEALLGMACEKIRGFSCSLAVRWPAWNVRTRRA